MTDLSQDEVKSLGRAVGLYINEPLLTEVTDNLNALWLGQLPIDDALKKIETDLNAQMKAP